VRLPPILAGMRLWALALLVCSGTSLAHAQESEAERVFKEGFELLRQGEAAGDDGVLSKACQKFEQSYALEKSLSPLVNLARCEEARARFRPALLRWREAADLALKEGDASLQILAQGRAAAMAEKLPKIRVSLSPRARAAKLTIDGEEVPPGDNVPVSPGKHVVLAELGTERDSREVEVDRGVLEVSLFAESPTGSSAPPVPKLDPERVDWAIPAWLSLGVGGAGLVTGILTSVVWKTECGEARDGFACSNGYDAGPLVGINLAGYILAGVGGGLSVVFFVLDANAEDDEPQPPALSVGAFGGSNVTGLRAFGAF
jgi:hypothetical protein